VVIEPQEHPNIILILSDDQPFYTALKMTKTLAWLRPGLEFTRAYCSTPLCGPNRATIHTGLYTHNHRIITNTQAARKFRSLGHPWRSIAHYLASEAGYACGYYGKYINDLEEMAPWVAPGYKRWIAVLANRDPVLANINGRVRRPKNEAGNHIRRRGETRWLGEKAKNFVEERTASGEHFFLFASIKAPHSPFEATDTNEARALAEPFPLEGHLNFDHHDPNKPPGISGIKEMSASAISWCRSVYRGKLAEIYDMDDAIDDLLSVVDFETTYVFFLTDNGFLIGNHRLTGKAAPYEESARTFLFARGPGCRENATTGFLVGSVDIAPTILELAGLGGTTQQKEMDGRSLAPLMFDLDPASIDWRDSLLLEEPQSAVHPHEWYALRTIGPDNLYVERDSGERELYDMQADPYQLESKQNDPAYGAEVSSGSHRLAQMREASGEQMRAAEMEEVAV
jgi:N-acetylglucosamine-6-sulfatase